MELTTEEKIITAARTIFTQKGFNATRTRDIADEAGINLALLNYYFRSKKNLFRIIIEEKFDELFGMIEPILSDVNVSLEEKIEALAANYTNLLLVNEDLPFFVLSELKSNEYILEKVKKNTRMLSQPVIENQLKERGFTISTLNFIMNIVSLILFPFISKPLFVSTGLVKEEDFTNFVMNRKQHIPTWVMNTLK
ncbi:MAG: TetR/AcrR family transcriptional regulator [Dysgonamonadaceae bacterium]|jgi:AcrR family transcriptional regulator|nr:TetR/AcrR family transcriptional regulator [Dysgonamonadaceae bacterium]MDD3355547.1 TetR/AcrR family transcriptional regulator [Dysgonamonadaceae bacterium]MDD3726940.1 TetR/AcrR family transcriptional regulator [Dysgonamonadaceae bacterium]MDD4245799.1 TetR/AcrR family transcriptional regulator [Dysgonamonadaceae bacterium]MDD4605178.1 TetR/AcrR family transcriptional regulator [Dysgonamonadaceae bacterium]